MEKIAFAFLTAPDDRAIQALRLSASIRDFGGEYAHQSILVLTPDLPGKPLPDEGKEKLHKLGAEVIPFPLRTDLQRFPFAAKTLASAHAEQVADGRAELVVWMDTDSILIREPRPLFLNETKLLGYRPVDLALIGSPADTEPDGFWQALYEDCAVPEGRVFTMITSVDRQEIRAYFNAGLLVVRPEAGLLRCWADNFSRLAIEDRYREWYRRDERYRIFFHQAALTATVLAEAEHRQLQEMPHTVNYPLHLHHDYPPIRRPVFLNELITARYDTFFQNRDWRQAGLHVKEPLKTWLDRQMP